MSDEGFLSRWSRRKTQRDPAPEPVAAIAPPVTAPPVVLPPAVAVTTAPVAAEPAPAPPPPTLEDVARLEPGAEVTRFVARDVDPSVKNAALKKLFADPHYNVMDGLDTYIDDYGKPDPLPEGMLRQLAQSQFLGLFRKEEEAEQQAEAARQAAAAASPVPLADATAPADPRPIEPIPDENAAVRLQPDDAAGHAGAGEGAGEDPRREC